MFTKMSGNTTCMNSFMKKRQETKIRTTNGGLGKPWMEQFHPVRNTWVFLTGRTLNTENTDQKLHFVYASISTIYEGKQAHLSTPLGWASISEDHGWAEASGHDDWGWC